MIFIITEGDIIFKAWDENEFTERKLKNAIEKIKRSAGPCEFINLLEQN